jgi:hypothetical protein
MFKRSVSFFVVLLLAGGLLVAGSPAMALSGTEACFFNSLNSERADVGRPKLVLKSDLVAVARNHSEEMADDETIYHNDNLANEVHGNWWALGENVGMGPSCSSIHNAFMASPGHKANILDTDYNQIGIGVEIRDDTIYVTEVFAGRPMGSSPKPTITQSKPPAPPKPKPKPKPAKAAPRTLPMLLLMLGMDSVKVDRRTGRALGV